MTDDAGRIVLGPASRELRRTLRPIEWVVLEDVALDARGDDTGALVAATSARRVAEHLGLTPGAAARALGRLRSAGLLTHSRQAGSAGRFGLSAYVVESVPGLRVLSPTEAPKNSGPRPARPHPAAPHAASPRVVEPHVAAGPPGSDDGKVGRWPDDDATAELAAADDLASEARARSTAGTARSRSVPKATPAQLSMFDATEDSSSETKPQRHP